MSDAKKSDDLTIVPPHKESGGRTTLIAIIAAILIAWALKATALVTMPLAFAVFIALVVWPIDKAVQSRVPDKLSWLGHVAAMMVVVLVLLLFIAGVAFVARSVADELPGHVEQIRQQLRSLAEGGGSGGSLPQTLLHALNSGDGGAGLLDIVSGFARRLLRSMGTTLSLMTLIFFFSLLMLIEAPRWCAKLETATRGRAEEAWFETIRASAQRFRWYLLVRTVVGLLTAALYGLWLWLFGVEFVMLWVVLTFLLSYVPTIGSLISGILPFGFALATKDLGTALLVGAGLLVIEQVMGNFVDPRMQGKRLAISPLVLLISLLVWAFIWGVAGTLIAVPMTVLLIVVFSHVRVLRPLALMLSDRTDYDGLDETLAP